MQSQVEGDRGTLEHRTDARVFSVRLLESAKASFSTPAVLMPLPWRLLVSTLEDMWTCNAGKIMCGESNSLEQDEPGVPRQGSGSLRCAIIFTKHCADNARKYRTCAL
jgi:hypothetical protein